MSSSALITFLSHLSQDEGFFFTSAYGKIQQAMVDSNGPGCVPRSGHALGMDKAAVTKCGITFRNLDVPFGAWKRAARSCLCGPGRFSLGAATPCTQQQHLPNITMISPRTTQAPQPPDEHLGICTCLLKHDSCVKRAY